MNQNIIDAFEKFYELRVSQGDEWKSRAYKTAAETIKNYPYVIESGKQAQSIPGIGKSLATKIQELLDTGTIAELSNLPGPSEKDTIIKMFQNVERVGQVTACKWYEQGYRTIEDVPQEAANEGQWIGLQLYYDLIQRIPRAEIVEAERILHECLDPLNIQFQIAGSYRRGRPDSGDIDILIIDKPDMDVMNTVLSCPIFTHRLAQGDKKFLGVGKIDQLHRRIDVELVQDYQYPFAITYFTGSGSFNVKMRKHASAHGLRLNEKGLFGPNDESYPAKTEQDVFAMLGLQYLTPEERDKY